MSKRSLILYIALYALIVVVWATVGAYVVPQIVSDAYDGKSWGFINSIFDGQSSPAKEHYLNKWQRFYVTSVVVLMGIPLLFLVANRLCIQFFNRFVGHSSPQSLGAIRFWIFSILAVNVLWEDLPSIAYLPGQLRSRMGVMLLIHKIPGWDSIYSSYHALLVLKVATLIALFLALIGLKTKWSVPLASLLALLHGGILREYSHFFHTCLLPIHVAIALSFMPCGDGFSVDRYLSKLKVNDSPQNQGLLAKYGWSRYICWGLIAAAYTAAGLSKIANGGLWWWHGENLKKIVLTDTLNPMQFEFGLEHELAYLPVGLFSVMGLSAVIIESTFGVVLFSRRARLVLPVLVIGMHLGILICQGILFFDLILIQAVFFDFTRILPENLQLKDSVKQASESPRSHSLHARWFTIFLLLMSVLAAFWASRLELYPLTAWQMYSGVSESELIKYNKVFAVYADGRKEEARLEYWIGALADSRYRDILKKTTQQQAAFFKMLLSLANKGSQQPKIIRFEVETVEWRFLTNADDPDFGTVKSVEHYP
ncbi:hypothetical protein DTL21_09570 [Bremerella cremea]|uniref:HTTM domain-containing protein n=1 Tax=Blastopirellula marina TaxID=124 RepID=A0A2S8FWD9_9BACT|nr:MULTISPECIES: hypothetical protein [Pirellulaceae]PQO36154.1 hypothetical protein C5Y83_09565 [Blastopirellula marina]RCS48831.1 hypothetical protein DTL21_09570 [Bremerella cremea]